MNLYDGVAYLDPGREKTRKYSFQVQSLKDIDGKADSPKWLPLRP